MGRCAPTMLASVSCVAESSSHTPSGTYHALPVGDRPEQREQPFLDPRELADRLLQERLARLLCGALEDRAHQRRPVSGHRVQTGVQQHEPRGREHRPLPVQRNRVGLNSVEQDELSRTDQACAAAAGHVQVDRQRPAEHEIAVQSVPHARGLREAGRAPAGPVPARCPGRRPDRGPVERLALRVRCRGRGPRRAGVCPVPARCPAVRGHRWKAGASCADLHPQTWSARAIKRNGRPARATSQGAAIVAAVARRVRDGNPRPGGRHFSVS